MTEVVAHRTCPLDAPENSREGLAFAATAGADVVEIDLRLSRDGTPVLSHDPWTFRTTWWPLVVGWSPARWLTRLKLKGGSETLPAFTDVLAVLPEGVELALDVKDGRSMGAAIDTAEAAGLLDRMRLWSSHPEAVAVALRRAPTRERAWLHNTETEAAALAYLRRAGEVGATAVSVMDVSLTPEVVRVGHDLGLRVNSWVRTREIQDRVLACEPDAVVTDWVAEARAALGR